MADSPTEDQELTGALRALTSATGEVAAAQARQAATVEQVLDQVRRLRGEPGLMAALRHVYWQHPAVPSKPLAAAAQFRSPGDMVAALGPVPSGITCEGCGAELLRTSRSWTAPDRQHCGGLVLCRECRSRRSEALDRKWALDAVRRGHVQDAPVAARGRDWLVPVSLVLAYPPVAVDWNPETVEREGLWYGYDIAQQVQEVLAGFDHEDLVGVSVGQATRLLTVAQEVAAWDTARALDLVQGFTGEVPAAVLARLGKAVEVVRAQRKREAAEVYPDDWVPPASS